MNTSKKHPSFWLSATTAQARDTGMALALICLLLAFFGGKRAFLTAAIVLQVVTMARPGLFKPAAKLWFGFSHILGTVMSKILLGVVFLIVVTPMALFRRMIGKDAMQLKSWKKDAASVFRVRDHTFTAHDIETPY